MTHPGVAQAVAFAAPSRLLGEEVAAAIVVHDGCVVSERELRRTARQRLAPFKVPRRIVFVDNIPLGATGKLQRVGLASRLGVAGASSKNHRMTATG